MPFTAKQQSKLFLDAIKDEPIKNLSQIVAKKFVKTPPIKKASSKADKFMNIKKMLAGKV